MASSKCAGSVGFLQVGEKVNAIGTVTSNQVLDLSKGNVHSLTLTANPIQLSFSNVASAGQCSTVTLIIINGGLATLTWAVTPLWASNAAPVLSSSGVDILMLTTVDGGGTWYGIPASLGAA